MESNSKPDPKGRMNDKTDVKKVAQLARLKLRENEEAYFEEKFNAIMEYVGTISGVEISSDMKEKDESLQQIFRPDQTEKSPVQPDQFSDYVESHFFKVPRIIE